MCCMVRMVGMVYIYWTQSLEVIRKIRGFRSSKNNGSTTWTIIREDSDVMLCKKSLFHCMLNHKSCFEWKTPSFARIFDQTLKPVIWKSHGGLENLPHDVTSKHTRWMGFLHLTSAVMTYIHPWKLSWNTIVEVWKMIFQTYNRRFLGSMWIFRGCTYCFIWNYGKICCSPFFKNFFWRVPVPHDLERIHTQITWSPKKTPEICPNSFYYPSSHNHGIVETIVKETSLGVNPLATSMIPDERVKPKWFFGVSPTMQGRSMLCTSTWKIIVSIRMAHCLGPSSWRCLWPVTGDFRPKKP